MTYPVKNPELDIINIDFSDDLGICGNFTYTLTNSDDSAFDTSIFTFDD